MSWVSSVQAYNADDVHVAAESARYPVTVAHIFRVEIGGVGYNPHAIHGDLRVLGPGGLCTCGLLPVFYRAGFSDPENPFQVAAFIDQMADEGLLCNWKYLC